MPDFGAGTHRDKTVFFLNQMLILQRPRQAGDGAFSDPGPVIANAD
jgi:hypothetical protein